LFVDARTVPDGSVLDTDICIVGAGAAGIALALEFAGGPLRVALMESGDLEPDLDTQSLYDGDNIGLPYYALAASRLRQFGGTTNHWGKLCGPFGELDFETRDWVPNSGWPIQRSDLDSYYPRAASVFQVEPANWDSGFWSDRSPFEEIRFEGGRVGTRIALSSGFRSIGAAYEHTMRSSENVTTYLNANVTEFHASENGRSVTSASVACLTGSRFSVTAPIFILSAGALESARLLMLSSGTHASGLGNESGLLGRFFMEHARFLTGVLHPSDPGRTWQFYNRHMARGKRVKAYLTLSDAVKRNEGLADVQMRLDLVGDRRYVEAEDSKGRQSAARIREALGKREMPDALGKHLMNVLSDLDQFGVFGYQKVRLGYTPVSEIELVPRVEPTPNPDSRVTLSDEVDGLGQRRLQLNWQLLPRDKRNAHRTTEIMAAEIGRAGLGRVRIVLDPEEPGWPKDLRGGWHHMGTTRMSDDPGQGVVDRDCRVHGLSNLYVSACSVFPTAGSGTPTFTLVALAIRLADHVKRLMQ
jgi:choline dehydrogenase-like flavoprotein